jgi:flagellar basal body-associated protein FliL
MAKSPQKTASKAAAVKAEEPVVVIAPKKSLGMMLGIALVGLLVGGGGAGGYFMFLGPKAEARAAQKALAAKAAEAALPPETLKIDRMVLPMLTHGGDLKGYVTLEMVMELDKESSDFVKVRLPMIRHEFNATMANNSILNANDDALDFALASQMLTKAANTALGQAKVRKVNIVTAVPL